MKQIVMLLLVCSLLCPWVRGGDEPTAADPRPRILLIGGMNCMPFSGGGAWGQLVAANHPEWQMTVKADAKWQLPEMVSQLDTILSDLPRQNMVLVMTGTMEASNKAYAEHDAAALGKMMGQLLDRLQSHPKTKDAQRVVITPMPVVDSRLDKWVRKQFAPDGEAHCRAIRDAFVEAAKAKGASVIDFYQYAWEMDKDPRNPNSKPDRPGFLVYSNGHRIRDWGFPIMAPWMDQQIEQLKPASSDPKAYQQWLATRAQQSEVDAILASTCAGTPQHGPALKMTGPMRADIPVSALQAGPWLTVLVKAKDRPTNVAYSDGEYRPAREIAKHGKKRQISASGTDTLLTVQTESGPVMIGSPKGQWAVIDESLGDKPVDRKRFFKNAGGKMRYYGRVDPTAGKQMWMLVRFPTTDLADQKVTGAGVQLNPGYGDSDRVPVQLYLLQGPDVQWNPAKATWRSRNGKLGWTGGKVDIAARRKALESYASQPDTTEAIKQRIAEELKQLAR